MELSRLRPSSSLCLLVSISVFVTLSSERALAQDVDGSSLLRPGASANGEPFPRQAEPQLLAQATFAVPPVAGRTGDVDQGPRVVVSRFDLSGAVDRPGGVSVAEVNALLRNRITSQPAGGYTVGQLGEIADEVTRYYRERGLILAQAYVPAQEVQGGAVQIAVVEGTLGGVTVDQGAMYRDRALTAPFDSLLNQPVVQNDVESALLTLQEFPGLTTFGTFTQGSEPGETDLLLQVLDEDRFAITPMVDNYGSESTGEYRFSLQFAINNPFGARDRISGYVQKTYEPENGDYGGLEYEVITRSGRGAFGLGASSNSFDVTDATVDVDLGLRGEVDQAHVFHRRTFLQSRPARVSGTLDVAAKEAVTIVTGADPTDELTNLSYQIDYFAAGAARQGVHVGHFRWLWGDNDSANSSRLHSNFEPVTGGYRKLDYSYQYLRRLGPSHSVLFRTNGQYSDAELVPIEQFSLGGPANVRAYAVATGLVDKGNFASLEWIISPAGLASKSAGTDRRTGQQRYWNEIFQFSFFLDYAQGNVNDPLPGQPDKIDLSGVGFGLQFSAAERFYFRLDAAKANERPNPVNLVSDEDFNDVRYHVGAWMTF